MKYHGNVLSQDIWFATLSAVVGGGLLVFMLVKLISQIQTHYLPDRDDRKQPVKEWVVNR
jgi:hypothetical protein